MDEKGRRERELDAPEIIAAEPENPRVLKEHEPDLGPYVTEAEK